MVVPGQTPAKPDGLPPTRACGWTGDWQLFIPTGAFRYDVAGFSLKWLRDVAAEQLPDGRIINYSPDPLRQQVESTGLWQRMQGSSGWGDAVVMVPWEMWRAYGDSDVLAEPWPSMVSWVDFAALRRADRAHWAHARA
jgi:alpha-L-rhamnosidase